jgi:hypothetical protein
MIVLLYTIIVLCVIAIGVVCAIQCFLLLSDAILYRRDKSTAFVSGAVMGVGFCACLSAFLWLIDNTPL